MENLTTSSNMTGTYQLDTTPVPLGSDPLNSIITQQQMLKMQIEEESKSESGGGTIGQEEEEEAGP